MLTSRNNAALAEKVIGSVALVPVVKISSRTALAEKWPDLIDIDAGRIASRMRSRRSIRGR